MSLGETTILLVDDEELIRKSLTRELQQENFTVTTVSSGREAINALKIRKYDLVITDLMMPDVDGFKVLEVVKKVACLTSVIILSAYGNMQSVIDALRSGADDFVRKPCEIEELVFRIQQCMEKRNLSLERERAEKALRASEERYRSILKASLDDILITDLEGRILAGSPTGVTRLGYDREEEVLGHLVTDFIDPEDRGRALSNIALRFQGGITGAHEYKGLRKDGRNIDVEVNSDFIRDKDGQPSNMVFVVRDITERKTAERALQESEEKYRTLAESAYSMEAWRMPDGAYQYISPSCERVTGYAAAEFLTDPNFIAQITHPDDKAMVIEHYCKALHNTNSQNMGLDFRILTPDGEIRWISHSCTAVCGEDGKWLGRRQSNREITNQKQIEEALRKSEAFNQQLQKNESLDRMAGAIAHLFNNQLGAVIGNLELAILDLPIDVEPVNRLNNAMQAAYKAAEVSGLMLTYLGHTTGKHIPLSLSELCRKSLPLLQVAATKDLILELDLSSPDLTINGNANQIQQILLNLVNNAQEALGESQGDINLAVKTVSLVDIPEAYRFPFDWKSQDVTYACMEVKDAGCGIACEDINMIFDPFFSRKFTGRGLGLPVVLGILKAHGGAIAVESEMGRGSIFRVFLPISSEVIPRKPEKVTQPSTGERRGTVLLVEDEELMSELSNTLLTQLGFTVLMAKDGVEAVDVYRKWQEEISCVVCDFKMKPKDGYEIFNTLRQINPNVKVIISSGYRKEEIFACFAGQGLNGFIQKPFSQVDFATEVLEVLGQEERKIA